MANHIHTATRYLVEDKEEEADDNEFEEEEEDDDDDDDDEEEEEEKSVELELIVESQLKKKRLNLDNKGSVKKGSNSTTRDGGGGGGGGGGGVAQPCCQVEKCEVDLSYAKKYYKRHKVCEVHAKAPIVLVAGLRQRFCQQCSRFHELSEFDGTKRSCRRRLAGHNERRRKTTQSPKLEDNQCRQVNGEGSSQITFSSNNSIKNYQIR